MKKVLAIIFALVIIFSMSTTVFAAKGDSQVSVVVDSQNLSVTLPLNTSVTAKVDGGSAVVPTDDSYKIINNSAVPIKVDTVEVVLNDATDWAFNGTPIAAGTAQNGGKNSIYFQVNGLTLAVQEATKPTNATDWNINAGQTKILPIVCSTSMLDQTETETNLFTITYEVSAGSHPTT